MLDPRDPGQRGPAAGGDQDVRRRVGPAGNLDRVRIEEARAAFDQADTRGLEQRAVEVLELRDLAILVRDQRRPREFGLRGPAIRARVSKSSR